MIGEIIFSKNSINSPLFIGLGLGVGVITILSFSIFRKLKYKKTSYKNIENRIPVIQSHQIEKKQTMASISSVKANPFVRLIMGFTGSAGVLHRATRYEQLRETEEQARDVSVMPVARSTMTGVDAGSQVCQEIISKLERRNRSEGSNEGQETPREGFIQEIFGQSNAKDASAMASSSEADKEEESKLSMQYTCAICLDVLCLGNTNMTTTGCGHTFHLSCLLKNLRLRNVCPMCRWPLEDARPKIQTPNVLTPVSAEQIISEEISYFPNAAHAQSITLSRHPNRRVKDLLRVFGFTLLRSVAEYVHDENMPEGWYDDGESESESESGEETDSDGEEEEEEEGQAGEGNNSDGDGDNENEDVGEEGDNEDEFNYANFELDNRGRRLASIGGDLREHIGQS